MKKRLNILLVNDDGIFARGILALVKTLGGEHNLYVSAPDRQRSAASQSITISHVVKVEEREVIGTIAAIATSGTPADCTKIGMSYFGSRGVKFDMVMSGINLGSNVGYDTLYSGTVGAAMEAALDGHVAIALSVNDHKAVEFEYPCRVAKMLADNVDKLPRGVVINVNSPHLAPEKIKGIKCTKLGPRYYSDKFLPVEGGYELIGAPASFDHLSMDYDVVALTNDYATITPLLYDYTDHSRLEEAYKLVEVIRGELK